MQQIYQYACEINNMKASVIRKENTIIQDELGSTITLRNTRVVKGMATDIVSLLQLVEEGWNITTKKIRGKTYIHVTKDGCRLAFMERDRKKLCFPNA